MNGTTSGTRYLFVSDTTIGGSGRSQRELAAELAAAGAEVRFLVDDGRQDRATRWFAEQSADLAVRLANTPMQRMAAGLAALPGRRFRSSRREGLAYASSSVPHNALVGQVEAFGPDVVVVNSVERHSWRRISATLAALDVVVVAYVREIDSLDHFAHGEVPDLLVANAESLQHVLQAKGLECAFVPSVIDVQVTAVEPKRTVALVINPIPSKGVDLIWSLAAEVPEIPFVVQESWPLDATQVEAIEAVVGRHHNLELRRSAPPGPGLYSDARLLLVPYRVDSRPRVIAEAQANGIPVLAADVAALREAIGPGGVVLPADDVQAWAAAIRRGWNDAEWYDGLVAGARRHAARPGADPTFIAETFAGLVRRVRSES